MPKVIVTSSNNQHVFERRKKQQLRELTERTSCITPVNKQIGRFSWRNLNSTASGVRDVERYRTTLEHHLKRGAKWKLCLRAIIYGTLRICSERQKVSVNKDLSLTSSRARSD